MLLPTPCPRPVQTPLAIAERVRKDGAKVLREALSTWKPWIPPGVLTLCHHSPHSRVRHRKIFWHDPIRTPVPPQCLFCRSRTVCQTGRAVVAMCHAQLQSGCAHKRDLWQCRQGAGAAAGRVPHLQGQGVCV